MALRGSKIENFDELGFLVASRTFEKNPKATRIPNSSKLSILQPLREQFSFHHFTMRQSISVEGWYYINDTLTREQSEERINISLMFATLPLSLVLLAFLLKILLVLRSDNLDLLIFSRSEGE